LRRGVSARDRNLLQIAAVYVVLVGTPILLILFLLDIRGGGAAAPAPPVPPGEMATSMSDEFVRLLLTMALILAACTAVGSLLRRFGQPAVIGEILVGMLLGPSVLGALWPQGKAWLFPPAIMPTLGALAQLGAILFVFVAGMELDRRLVRSRSSVAVVVSHVSIALPFLIGVLLATAMHDHFAPEDVGFVPFALFLGVSMSVTALPVLARILMDKQLMRTEVGAIALACALVDDVTAWSLLALVVALVTASSKLDFVLVITLAMLFALVMVTVVRPLLRRLGSARLARMHEPFLSGVLVLVLLSALATEKIGVHAIFGAFVLGLMCPRGVEPFEWVREHIGALTTTLLLPLFFVFSGLRTDLGLLGSDLGLWLWCLLVFGVAVLGKLGGSALAARAVGMDWRESLQLGALMNCRGLTELVVLNVGLDLGVLSRTMFTMLVLMALVSTAMTSPIVDGLRRGTGRGSSGADPPASEVATEATAP
jgi:Kef-type K+ transport system membrane component KefB